MSLIMSVRHLRTLSPTSSRRPATETHGAFLCFGHSLEVTHTPPHQVGKSQAKAYSIATPRVKFSLDRPAASAAHSEISPHLPQNKWIKRVSMKPGSSAPEQYGDVVGRGRSCDRTSDACQRCLSGVRLAGAEPYCQQQPGVNSRLYLL